MIILETTRKLPDHFTSAASLSLSLSIYTSSLWMCSIESKRASPAAAAIAVDLKWHKVITRTTTWMAQQILNGNFYWGTESGGAKNGPIVLILLVLLQALYNLHRSTLGWMGEWVAEWMDEELNSFRRIKSIFFTSTSLFAQSLQKRVLSTMKLLLFYIVGEVLILAGPVRCDDFTVSSE